MKKSTLLLLFALFIPSSILAQQQIDYGSNDQVGKFINISDIKVYYETYGEGEPLLLFHGNGGSMHHFGLQIPELSRHFKVIAVDSRGQGRTTDSDKEITYSLMASDMNELIDKLKFESVYVAGYSDGGIIGIELAFAHPEKVKKLVAFGANYTHENAMATPDSVTMDIYDPLIVQFIAIRQAQAKIASVRSTPKPVISTGIKKKLEVLMEKYPNFTKEQLQQIKVPTLIMAGDHDLISLQHTIDLFSSLPHAQLFIIPGVTQIGRASCRERV